MGEREVFIFVGLYFQGIKSWVLALIFDPKRRVFMVALVLLRALKFWPVKRDVFLLIVGPLKLFFPAIRRMN